MSSPARSSRANVGSMPWNASARRMCPCPPSARRPDRRRRRCPGPRSGSRGSRRRTRPSRRARRPARRPRLPDRAHDAVGRPGGGDRVEVLLGQRLEVGAHDRLGCGCLSARGHARTVPSCPCEADPTAGGGRGERVLPGLWRLRLPLPWPGVPHCNAWAIAAGDGIVLVDTGTYEPGSMSHLERALDQVGLKVEHAARGDHPRPRRPLRPGAPDRRSRGLRGLGHPNHQHFSAYADDPTPRTPAASRSPARAACRATRRARGARLPPGTAARPRPAARPRRRERPRHLVGARDAGPRAVARRALPARAAAADLRRSPARACVAVLRLRLHA